ncbi:MAG: hypothetical protein IKM97_01435 [Clostridia bacterium]|nr:hypothetical protein [Clostridia bacterium]
MNNNRKKYLKRLFTILLSLSLFLPKVLENIGIHINHENEPVALEDVSKPDDENNENTVLHSELESEKDPKNTEDSEYVFLKEKLTEQLGKTHIVLDGNVFGNYIRSVKIDGNKLIVKTIDGTILNSEIQYGVDIFGDSEPNFVMKNLVLDDLEIENFYFSSLQKNQNSEENNYFLNVDFSNVSILEECRVLGYNLLAGIDLSNCKKVWLQGNNIELNANHLRQLQNNQSLEKLYIGGCKLPEDLNVIIFNSNNLTTFILEGGIYPQIRQISFQGENLRVASFGSETGIKTLDKIGKINNLQIFSFGTHIAGLIGAYNFEDEEQSLGQIYPLDNIYIGTPINTILTDISALEKAKKLQKLNVEALNSITSDQLAELVEKLPELNELIGSPINNAMLFSPKLDTIIQERGIKHFFSDQSRDIKKTVQDITRELNLEEQSDIEKIIRIAEYVINHMEYNYEALKSPRELSRELIVQTWGEKLATALFQGKGVCDGYQILTQALLLEAGVCSYREENNGHTWVCVELQIDGETQYFQLDTTKIDENGETIINEDTQYFLAQKGDEDYQEPYIDISNNDNNMGNRTKKVNDLYKLAILGGLSLSGFLKPIGNNRFDSDLRINIPIDTPLSELIDFSKLITSNSKGSKGSKGADKFFNGYR